MIKTENLTKVFKTKEVETTAINDLSINIEKGEFVGIMGPSGCGKSTLLNIIGMLDASTSGSYFFNGIDVSRITEQLRTSARKGKIGFVFQNFNLVEDLNVSENVELPLAYLNFSHKERKRLIEEVLDRMNIGHRAKHFPNQLSGGQQQRVAIARAVVANPMLILADEPTGNLDSKNGIEVMRLLTEYNQAGTTIVMVTHSQRDAAYSHRLIKLYDGSIVE
ncbi:MAG TPA: phosphonate ABC transporter ATP-binding protein [Bacteroidales bacterium]|nr:phosphonate ABC transporter ATP-binding protein [Bacteroidales bacterium]